MATILITGSAGFVGKNAYTILKNAHRVIGIAKDKDEYVDLICDITDKKQVEDAVKKTKPDSIIHTAALSHVEYCETHRAESYAVNVGGTKHLIESIKGSDVQFIFLSSDYVYDGAKGNFTEESIPHPVNYYGENKLEAEEVVKTHPNHLILRTGVVFGWDKGGKNFFMQIYENQKSKTPMKVPRDQWNNPTYVKLLVEIIAQSIEKKLTGLWIATGPETMNRYEFGLRICDAFGFDKTLLKPVETKELGQKAKRPLNCGTDSTKIQRALDMKFPSIQKSLEELNAIIT